MIPVGYKLFFNPLISLGNYRQVSCLAGSYLMNVVHVAHVGPIGVLTIVSERPQCNNRANLPTIGIVGGGVVLYQVTDFH